MRKVVAITHSPSSDSAVSAVSAVSAASAPDGVTGISVHTPSPEAPPAQPDDVHAIWLLWLDGTVDALDAARTVVDGVPMTAYLVDERVQWDYERDWPVGEPSPGVKQLSFVRRLPPLTREEFAAHWNDVHAPLARIHHPGIWRYVQNVVVEPLTPDAPELDGVAELHFRTYDDLVHRMYDSDEGKALIRADVRNFLDVPAGWRMLATELILPTFDGAQPGEGDGRPSVS